MAEFQGLNNLSKGICKKINKFEINRGYIYITKDREVLKRVKDKLSITINGEKHKKNLIDSSGRITIGVDVSRKMADKDVCLKLEGTKISIVF